MAAPATAGGGDDVLALYDETLPRVYGYLLSRCGRAALAEDLCAQTFLAAVRAARRGEPPSLSPAWLMGVARHKLVDHWRAQAREEAGLALVDAGSGPDHDDPWDIRLDALLAHQTLERLGPHHQRPDAALSRRPPGPRSGPGARPHRPRHRGSPGAGPPGVPEHLRGGGGGR